MSSGAAGGAERGGARRWRWLRAGRPGRPASLRRALRASLSCPRGASRARPGCSRRSGSLEARRWARAPLGVPVRPPRPVSPQPLGGCGENLGPGHRRGPAPASALTSAGGYSRSFPPARKFSSAQELLRRRAGASSPCPPGSGSPSRRRASVRHTFTEHLLGPVLGTRGSQTDLGSPFLGSTKIAKETHKRIFSYTLWSSRGRATASGRAVG